MPTIICFTGTFLTACEDAAFIKDNLKLAESEESLCPISLSQHELWRNLTQDMAAFSQNLKQAYRKISRGKDVVVMEGLSNLSVDKVSTLACYTVADALEAKVIVVLNYSPNFDVSKIVQVGTKVKHLAGVIINLVPQSKIETAGRELAASFNKAGINDGDYVLVRNQSVADYGDKVVALIGDEATIKYFQYDQD